MSYGRTFAFANANAGEACPVCLLDDNDLQYVTYRCGHRVCASCFSTVRRTLPGHLPPNPVDFGCILFEDEYEIIMDEWLMVFPMQYQLFNAVANEYHLRLIAFNNSKRTLMSRCPICRVDGGPCSI